MVRLLFEIGGRPSSSQLETGPSSDAILQLGWSLLTIWSLAATLRSFISRGAGSLGISLPATEPSLKDSNNWWAHSWGSIPGW